MESFYVAFSTVLNKVLSSNQTGLYPRRQKENKLIHGIHKMNYAKMNATDEAGIKSDIAGSTFPANNL